MEQYFWSYVFHQQEDWAAILGMIELAANNHLSDTTGAFPFLANYEHHPRMNYTRAPPQVVILRCLTTTLWPA